MGDRSRASKHGVSSRCSRGIGCCEGMAFGRSRSARPASSSGASAALNPEGFPAFEIAYTLASWAWGKGYAREGAAAALRYARETLGRTEITSIIRPANTASIRVATSLGAVASESVEFFGAPSVIYRYPSV